MFLYLGASDFLPQIHETHEGEISRTKAVLSLLIGVIIMLAMFKLVPE
jgi:zinc transporter ZupT